MNETNILQDLFAHNDWANRKLMKLSLDLTDEQLDAPRQMGFGSLRNTWFHLREAEKLWLERWQGEPWRPLQNDAGGQSLESIAEEMETLARDRNELIDREAESQFGRVVDFKDSQQNRWSFPIGDLLNHVSNHGIHHRAQILSFLRGFDRRVAAGVDYLFWKMAYPTCEQPEESLAPLRQYGLEVATGTSKSLAFDRSRLQAYFSYADWAMDQVFRVVGTLDESLLDLEFQLGMGTLRKTLQHLVDAERWWVQNWESEHAEFPRGEVPRTFEQIQELYQATIASRNGKVADLNADEANRIVQVTAGGPITRFRVIESMLQLCGHGTHHRAQCLNMIRQVNNNPPAIDLVVWLRDRGSSSSRE